MITCYIMVLSDYYYYKLTNFNIKVVRSMKVLEGKLN